MIEIKNFDNWIEDIEAGKYGSGASEKTWLINPETKEKGLFKFPKVKNKEKGLITGEYWAEKLATEIGKLINVECARVDIGTYKGRIGSMSYNIIDKMSTLLTEGVQLIQAKYPLYNKDKLKEDKDGKIYSVQMIEKSLKIPGEMNEILKMIVFDCLIGNSDRHHSNWAEISKMDYKDGNFWFYWNISPLYDNGSSLCAYVNEEDIQNILKDKMRFKALLDTKSKSMIGWENKRPIRHFELLEKIKENYYEVTVKYIEKIKNNINEISINNVLNEFDDNIISSNMKNLLKLYILERRKRMLDIYNIENEV